MPDFQTHIATNTLNSKPNGLFDPDWRQCGLLELEVRINSIRQAAVNSHLSPEEWRKLDRMRARRRKLQLRTTEQVGRDGVTLADERAKQQETQTSTYTGAPVLDPTTAAVAIDVDPTLNITEAAALPEKFDPPTEEATSLEDLVPGYAAILLPSIASTAYSLR